MKKKSIMVRFKGEEVARVETILAAFPNLSASAVLKSVILQSKKVYYVNKISAQNSGVEPDYFF